VIAVSKVLSVLGRKVAIKAHTGKYLGPAGKDGVACSCPAPNPECHFVILPLDEEGYVII
jgi:hypothetical protein